MTTRARSFDSAAALYNANRPGYPPALFDTIQEFSGRPLAGARVADVGAGTGIATALLRARGADVLAVEPGDGMAAELHRSDPTVPVVRGDGDRLPLATGAFDLLTYAQSWHWTDPDRSVPEARRVLRPDGVLARWWNDLDGTVPWVAAQKARIAEHTAPVGRPPRHRQAEAETAPVVRRIRWSRRIPLDAHLANHASHSAFLLLGAESTAEFTTTERRRLLSLFPDGTIDEPYVVTLHLTRFS
ncbi:class I SAM-dependent methyltransferase (plasmid) [Streptomyces sp. BI20]|uniref:class I SAM-dependent methyltransferase n=1 Tax=Streptomyces sp. BI20 TaxID=3403460 RepID=UPI003C741759